MPDTANDRKELITMTATTSPTTALDQERVELLDQLASARLALINTTRDLSDEQAGERPTVSALCLGGLIKHVASMEDTWMRFVVEGPSAMSYDLPEGVTWADMAAGTAREFPQWAIDHQNDLRMLPGDTLAEVIDRYRQVAERSVEIIAAVPDLSARQPLPAAPWHEPGTAYSVRRVLAHLIAETAQHAGHADILREALDGRTSS
ncbi:MULTISPECIES: DinB family protein [Micromonospora]|uniref:DinB family protein n=1 Tax=Micromonospora TaxID=1873 RepID=UPI001E5731EA|nr:DinB family protein [Micromonospora sp. NRRL B-16802]